MKYVLISLMLALSANSFAEKAPNTVLRTKISDDEKSLSIQIDGNRNGQKIHFDQAFAVSNMSSLRKEVIKFKAFNSVGMIPPLHEVPYTLLSGVGLIVGFLTLVLLRFSRLKTALLNPIKAQRSE